MTMHYLIPARYNRVPGDSHACHIEQDGTPLCGVTLGEPYKPSHIKYAYNVCKACLAVQERPQMALFAEAVAR